MLNILIVFVLWYIFNIFLWINKIKLYEKIEYKRKVEIDGIENKI